MEFFSRLSNKILAWRAEPLAFFAAPGFSRRRRRRRRDAWAGRKGAIFKNISHPLGRKSTAPPAFCGLRTIDFPLAFPLNLEGISWSIVSVLLEISPFLLYYNSIRRLFRSKGPYLYR